MKIGCPENNLFAIRELPEDSSNNMKQPNATKLPVEIAFLRRQELKPGFY